MEKLLDRIIEKNRSLTGNGRVADYIPALSKADPNNIGICIVDLDGNTYSAGDYNTKFTIQSISKVIGLFLAIMDNGEERVFTKVGCEPTDEPFNTLYKLDFNHISRPSNPMINSGAIVTTSLIRGRGQEKFERLLDFTRLVSDNPQLTYNEEVYLSEKATGDRNRAIAYLMKSKGILEGDVEELLDIYFKQCSIEVTAVDIAKIGVFIANRSKDSPDYNMRIHSIVTAIMATCGMYNFSGEYSSTVGIPSKSGVGGGILASIPNKMGIGVFGPALDEYGNSIAGYGIMKDLSRELNLSMF